MVENMLLLPDASRDVPEEESADRCHGHRVQDVREPWKVDASVEVAREAEAKCNGQRAQEEA